MKLESSYSLALARSSSGAWGEDKQEEDIRSSFLLQSNEKDTIIYPSTLSIPKKEASSASAVRPEFLFVNHDFEELLENVTDMILDYYDVCGRPTETQLHDDYSTPQQILENLSLSTKNCLGATMIVWMISGLFFDTV
jgi:hypothetical protein